jgi:hypothetical protein
LQTTPSLALAFGLITFKTREKLLPVIFLTILVCTFAIFRFYLYPNSLYYLNFYQYLLGIKNKESYFTTFDRQALGLYQTAAFIKTHTQKDEPIFIWGNQPSLYALANRPVIGRYTVAYHIIDFNGYQETIKALTKNPPRWIIVMEGEKQPFPELFELIDSNYLFLKKIDSAQIFHRRSIID